MWSSATTTTMMKEWIMMNAIYSIVIKYIGAATAAMAAAAAANAILELLQIGNRLLQFLPKSLLLSQKFPLKFCCRRC